MSFVTTKQKKKSTREQRKEVSPRPLSYKVIGLGALSRSEGSRIASLKFLF